MESKSLLFGIIGFILGGLIVSIAATTNSDSSTSNSSSGHSMSSSQDLSNKSGDEFDKAFIAQMIDHHEGALEMAKLAQSHAKHDEIKQFSVTITTTQSKEIETLKTLQSRWNY